MTVYRDPETREYREQRVSDKARELARRYGADVVLAKLAELDA